MSHNNGLIQLEVEAVIFDMDGVITNTMPDHFLAWQEILKEEGIPVSKYDIYSREGQKGIVSLRGFFDDKGLPWSEERAHVLLEKKEEYFKRIVRNRLIPEAEDFIRGLSERGFRLSLVTGTAQHELKRIMPEHLLNLFEVVVTGTDVQLGKPDPEPFLLALEKLTVEPSAACVIENAPFGIQSAKGAGLKCIALETSLPADYLKEADYVFGSIEDIQNKMEFINTLSS